MDSKRIITPIQFYQEPLDPQIVCACSDQTTHSPTLESQMGISILKSSHFGDWADSSGKISLCLMAKAMGFEEKLPLVVDPAQDGEVVCADGS